MNMRRLLNLKGIQVWYLASGIALNVFWTIGLSVLISILFLKRVESGSTFVQLVLLAGMFVGPFLIAWLISAIASDLRGPTYGLYGSFGSVLVLLFVALPTGILGIMLIVAAISGGLNGGLITLRRQLDLSRQGKEKQ